MILVWIDHSSHLLGNYYLPKDDIKFGEKIYKAYCNFRLNSSFWLAFSDGSICWLKCELIKSGQISYHWKDVNVAHVIAVTGYI